MIDIGSCHDLYVHTLNNSVVLALFTHAVSTSWDGTTDSKIIASDDEIQVYTKINMLLLLDVSWSYKLDHATSLSVKSSLHAISYNNIVMSDANTRISSTKARQGKECQTQSLL